MIFLSHSLLGCLIMALGLLYLASLPGPWFTNEEATEIIPSWIVRVLAFIAALWFFYVVFWRLLHGKSL
jgi:membrane protein DedA with SNARE-associated domain